MSFIVATPNRTVLDDPARVLAKMKLLKGYFTGNRRGTSGIPGELTYLNPLFGLWTMATRRYLTGYQAEWLRSAAHPLFDSWVKLDVKSGDHIISSYGYANKCFEKVKNFGGKTFLDAGNSHPAQFWEIVSEEHRRWGVKRKPYPPHWNRAGRRTVELTDFVISPSEYVSDSFLSRGFQNSQIIQLPYPIDLSIFQSRKSVEISDLPIRIVCTGSVSLRKGFPYLLEAVRIIRKNYDAILVLTDNVESSMKDILPKFEDVPIEWSSSLPHQELSEHLKKCHVFALLSLEDGFARTVSEALACGLPAVVSENTGAKDLIKDGINGKIVGIRDSEAAAAAIIECYLKQLNDGPPEVGSIVQVLSQSTYELNFINAINQVLRS